MVEGKYEGLQANVVHLETPKIESWEFQYPYSKSLITISIPEFTCVCPKTGLPDFATLIIEYVPKEQCLELKSFKEYLLNFRDVGIFHEHVVNRVLNDCVQSCNPIQMFVQGVFNARGGIFTTAKVSYQLSKANS